MVEKKGYRYILKKTLYLFAACTMGFCFFTSSSYSMPDKAHKRVISLGPIITEMIYMLGAENQLVGNTIYCTVPADAKSIEKIGTVIQMNIEKIISLKPDIVIASTLSRKKQIEILKIQGMNVVKFENPKTFPEMCQMTIDLGSILGKKEKACKIVKTAQKEVDCIKKKTEKLIPKKVFIQLGLKPLHTVTKDIFVNEYIKYGGGVNIAENENTGIYSREKVLTANPDVIFIATMGSSKKAGEVEKRRWMKFRSINASANGEIYVLDPDIVCSPTLITFVKGLKEISSLIHPETIGR